ncbi:hypothetical protein RFI_12111 [Reticulomyxa filosa]|uniref:Endonuclease/exonuclease/phosphatase domain-containing protein n=1 Tax=Reticulomyxa filosa TaxID=46433 RepID=X6NI54_RETFI|nr:hypothetical protein RFI_12111 [Reticulomyxa filosa]|eukprot:ETO25032.1 hypothetical protein RFI_12111 [Reticulomyxa filosa]
MLCKGNHRSDSLICPKTKDIRQKLGISFVRRENEIINRKMNQNNNQNQKDNNYAIKMMNVCPSDRIEKFNMFIDKMMPLIEQKSKFVVTTFSNNAHINANETIYQCFCSKSQILEQNLYHSQHYICLLQECFRSEKQNTDNHFQYLYNHYWIETLRTGILCRKRQSFKQKINIQKHEVISEDAKGNKEDRRPSNNKAFYLSKFEKEFSTARKISDHIIIVDDWNAHHPAWLDKNVDEVGESILDLLSQTICIS